MSRWSDFAVFSAAFVCIGVGLVFPAYRFGFPLAGAVTAALASIVSVFFVTQRLAQSRSIAPLQGRPLAVFAIVAITALYMIVVYFAGFTLPAHDPIAVPTLAKAAAKGLLSTQVYEAGSSAYTYPPGEPILLAPFIVLLGPINTLFAFKIATLATYALTPATWAMLHGRAFAPAVSRTHLYLIFYVAFFGIERTIGFAPAFAGKNAVALGLLLLPLIIALCLECAPKPKLWFAGILSLFGLILIHYSMLHAAAAVLGSITIMRYLCGRISRRDVIGSAIMGLGAALLMFVFMSEIVGDPRSGTFNFKPSGIQELLAAFVARKPFLAIFNDAHFGILQSYYRGFTLIIALLIPLHAAHSLRDRTVAVPSVCYFAAIVISLLFCFNVVPAGITPDFMRWYLWPVQAALFASCGIVLLKVSQSQLARLSILSRSTLIAATGAAAILIIFDGWVYRTANAAQSLSRSDLVLLSQRLAADRCHIIAPSTAHPKLLVTVQRSKLLDYAEVVSNCRYANGSWVQPGVTDGRTLNGMPSKRALIRLAEDGEVFFIGKPDELERYAAATQTALWVLVGPIQEVSIWRLRRSSSRGQTPHKSLAATPPERLH
jgi:hypothetical protein